MLCLMACAMLAPAPLRAQATASPSLASVPFGPVDSLYADLVNRQNTCSFGGLAAVRYSVTGTGSGSGGAFTLSNGYSALPYQVQWAQTANASSGSTLTANQPLNGQITIGLLSGLTCALGLLNATVIVIVPAVSLQQGTAGSYSGSLSILLTAQ